MTIEERAVVGGKTISRDVAARRAKQYAAQLVTEAEARNIPAEELFTALAEITARENPNLAGKLLVALNQVVVSRLIVPAMRNEDASEKVSKN
jgi:hypothetical protein